MKLALHLRQALIIKCKFDVDSRELAADFNGT
jgi:hypothetical protein